MTEPATANRLPRHYLELACKELLFIEAVPLSAESVSTRERIFAKAVPKAIERLLAKR